MAINTKDVLDMSPAFFAELQEVAVTENGLSNWASLASSVNGLKKEARILQPISKSPTLRYMKTNPLSRFMTSIPVHSAGGALTGAAAGAATGGPLGAMLGAGAGAGLGALKPLFVRTVTTRGVAGRIAKAKQKGLPPLSLLTGQEAKAVRAGQVKLPTKVKALLKD